MIPEFPRCLVGSSSLSIAVCSKILAISASFAKRSISRPLPCETAMEMVDNLSCALPRPLFGSKAIITASVFTKSSVRCRSFFILPGLNHQSAQHVVGLGQSTGPAMMGMFEILRAQPPLMLASSV
jgi:hypothetical protein